MHVYTPLLFFSGVDYIDPPTPYMMGLHSSVDTPCNRWCKVLLKIIGESFVWLNK